MKRLLLCTVVIGFAALGWFGFAWLSRETPLAAPAAVVASVPKPAVSAPQAKMPVTNPVAPVVPPRPATRSRLEMQLASASRPMVEKINLAVSLDANGHYHDDLRGVSADLPEGWVINDAQRWGEGNRQNTVWMSPNPPTSARPSMYYQTYPENRPDFSAIETYFRGVAETKETSRNGAGVGDYRNVPESFEFTQINGRPAMTYFATFTRGNEVMTEHFIRVLGDNGYVMFFTPGTLEDVKTILPQLKAMAASVKVP